ncbi:MAG: hypothetical protein KTR35_24255 [Gammaproteobacteria bacterium]|nr:hypothetical protein [Gammaproteobacteria bacterium]
MSAIAVIDIGKTNAKLSCVEAHSGVLLSSTSTETQIKNGALYPHIDTESMWHWYLSALKQQQTLNDIQTIVVLAHGSTAALVNENGLVLPVMDYEFDGPDVISEEYNALRDPFSETFSPPLPLALNLGRQLFWQRRYFKADYQRATHLLTYPQFWTWKLTGRMASEVSSIGAATDLWHPMENRYSDFADREGFSPLFPERRFAGDVLGSITAELAQATGIRENCRVLVGIHDSNASLLPWLTSRDTPFTVMSTGTWVINFSVGASLEGLSAERDCLANVTIHSEPVACSRFMAGREYAAIAGSETVHPTVDDLLNIIDDDIFALPSFTDTGGPFPGMAGMVQTHRNLTALDRHALASLYCALVCDESLTVCNATGDIIVEGAFAKNSLFLQCLAVFRTEQRLLASADSTGTTLGATLLAMPNINAPELMPAVETEPKLERKLIDYKAQWKKRMATGHQTL